MNKLIFLCVFFNPKYIKLALTLLESLYKFGKLDDETKILIYTSTAFMNAIKKTELYRDKIIFHVNDNKNSVELACKSRIDLFNIPCVKEFNQILYLDVDMVITGDVNLLFNSMTEDLLYAVGMGKVNDPADYFGASLFGDDLSKYGEEKAFCSGLLLFNNTVTIRTLFENIENQMKNNNRYYSCYDQPFFVYNAIKDNLADTKTLNQYDSKVFDHHFGGPGYADKKLVSLPEKLNDLIKDTSSGIIVKTKEYIDTHLMPIINNLGEKLEGNIFMSHLEGKYTQTWEEKQYNICDLVLDSNIKDVLEIGFNSGFSALLMLMANDAVKITCVDINDHKYTVPCYNKLKETFGDRITLHCGDSRQVVPTLNKQNKFDLIHIDGGHTIDVFSYDIKNSYKLCKKEETNKTIIIMDDYDFPEIHMIWDFVVNFTSMKNTTKNMHSRFHSIKVVDFDET